ncbi:MAG TPA: ATP-dependent DNA helicase [Ferruginibacter sp.]|nr:ATP-dependent DNA helicase [Ferruginibacter sp.]HMP19746.1 ATP-dependent DNA helicase [Ferruginibacter sp.]
MQTYQQQLRKKFDEVYQQLNQQQRIAVDTIEGPVMVIAGPGTGKTQILAARIGKILLDTDALPDNILCLTYTDAGAIAMRRRLQQFIGADAYKVNIYTFHAFCNDIIQDNLNLFEKTALDAISELESIQLFKQLIDDFPKNHPLKRYRGDVYFEINNLRQLFSNMKKEGWTPVYMHQKIDAYLQSLPTRDEFVYKRKYKQYNAGDLKQEKIEEETERMEKLRAAVNEFEHYQQLMKQRNRYDFDDMINWVIQAFEENKNLLANYQEKFQYILVDEYQDTSGTQNRLVELLVNYWDEPNLFVVGDDDQSIYRFQGANVENMENLMSAYQTIKAIVLENNYRSTQPILDISKTLIEKNAERLIHKRKDLNLTKNLIASNTKINALQHPPEIREYNSVKEEMAGITMEVEALLKNDVPPGKIAIIYKENKYGEELAAFFRLKGIPFYSKKSINILRQPFIKKVMQLLRYLNAEHDIPYGGDEMLFEILHYDFYTIPPIEIAKLTVEVNQKKYSGELIAIRRLLFDKTHAAPKNLFDTGLHSGLARAGTMLEKLIADVPNLTLQQLFANMVQQAGILAYIMQSPDKIQLLQLLNALFDFIKTETSRNPSLQLSGFIDIINLMEKEELPLPMVQLSGSEKGVNLITAHGSKGLEFEYVFVAGANSAFWEKKRKPGGGYKLPDTMFNTAATQTAGHDEEELRRLFYVALTRAEKHLYISYAKLRNDGKEIEPSMFIAEIQQVHQLPVEKITMPQEVMLEFESLQFTALAPEIQKAEDDFIDGLLAKFMMNVTALNNYLKCPLQFYYQSLIRIPTGKNEATEFGSAVHHALEKLFRKMQENGKELFPPKADMIEDFKWYLRRHRENFTPEAFSRRLEYGEKILADYYDKYIHEWNKIVAVERNIRGVVVQGVPLKGKLDKLEFNGRDINVVDYKTGDIDKALPKLKGPDDKNPDGGDYWRQAVFYKLLIDNYEQKDWKAISTEFDFVEPDKKNQYRKQKLVITPADTETVTQQLKMVWDKIQNRDFYTGCGKADCHWCNFVKDNQLQVALHELAEEAAEEQ